MIMNYNKGDWVTCLPGYVQGDDEEYSGGMGYEDGKTFQVDHFTVYDGKRVLWPQSGNGIYEQVVRLATPDEIRAAGGVPVGSSGVKRKLSELTGKWAIHCTTQQEADQVCKLLVENVSSYKNESVSRWAAYWEKYKTETCYQHYTGYTSKNLYTEWEYTIYPASDFIDSIPVQSTEPVMVTEDNCYIGMKVTKGRDWDWKGQGDDIGEIYKDKHQPKWIPVKWANGQKNNYRIGSDGKYDLYIYQEQTSNYSQSKTNTNATNKQEGPKSQESADAIYSINLRGYPKAVIVSGTEAGEGYTAASKIKSKIIEGIY